jgi:PAS domain S-box-containing protein
MNFFKSPRNKNQSKRFPTREPEPEPERRVPEKRAPREVLTKPNPRQELRVAIPTRSQSTDNTISAADLKDLRTRNQSLTESSMSSRKTGRTTSRLGVEDSIKEESVEEERKEQPQPLTSDSDFDLRPPPRKETATTLEVLSDLLYSQGYLETITNDPALLGRFSVFLNKYRPDIAPLIQHYLETQKVIKATAYANAVASALSDGKSTKMPPAVELTASFLVSSRRAFNTLLQEALPAWVTYSLVKTATSCLKAEIMNQSTPLTRDLLGGLSEVFCISDPNQPDNPLIYASDEFYRLTGYGRDFALGQNCRFLQGPKTRRECPRRLRTAIDNEEELCETILNYQRDGTPFVNIVLLAPLYDSKGRLKYFLGAQVDASRLVEDGRGVDGFDKFLRRREFESKQINIGDKEPKEKILARLKDLGKTFDLEESAVVEDSSRSSTFAAEAQVDMSTGRSSYGMGRNVIYDDDDLSSTDTEDSGGKADADENAWALSSSITSGRLPGIYQKYILMRPYPSLKMIFVSHRAKRLGQLTQQPFLAHIAAPATTISGLRSSLESGRPVSAKVAIMSRRGASRDGTVTGRWSKKVHRQEGQINPAAIGRTSWISATPLLDSERKIGVWMVVIVDKPGTDTSTELSLDDSQAGTRRASKVGSSSIGQRRTKNPSFSHPEDVPIKPMRVGNVSSPTGSMPEKPRLGDDFGIMKDDVSDIREGADRSSKEEEDSFEVAEAVLQRIERAQTVSTIQSSKYDETDRSPAMSRNSFQICEPADFGVENDKSGSRTPIRATYGREVEAGMQSSATSPSIQNMEKKRDVGLRAMDYISSRSPINRKNKTGGGGPQDKGDVTPNSVD